MIRSLFSDATNASKLISFPCTVNNVLDWMPFFIKEDYFFKFQDISLVNLFDTLPTY